MTEMERMLKESLLALEGELAAKLHRQETWLSGQQTRMEDQGRQIQALRREVLQLREGQQILMRHLQRLSAVHESLLPALTRLHSILNGRQRPARTTACAGADRRFGEAVPRRALPIEGRFLRCIPCEVAAQRDPSGATGSFFTPCGILSPRGWCRRASRFIRCNGAWGTRPLP